MGAAAEGVTGTGAGAAGVGGGGGGAGAGVVATITGFLTGFASTLMSLVISLKTPEFCGNRILLLLVLKSTSVGVGSVARRVVLAGVTRVEKRPALACNKLVVAVAVCCWGPTLGPERKVSFQSKTVNYDGKKILKIAYSKFFIGYIRIKNLTFSC